MSIAGQHRSERFYEKMIESGSDVFLLLDRTGMVLFRSASGKHITLWDDDEIFARPMTDFLAPDCWAAAQKAIAEMLQDPGKPVRVEMRVRKKDGSYLDMEVVGRNLLDDPDVQGIVIAAHDVTGRKQVERALVESRQVLESILNAIPVRVFWKDENLVYLGCNRSFAQDAGVAEPEAVIGKDDFQLAWGKEQSEKYRRDDREVLESRSAKSLIEEPQTSSTGDNRTLLTSKVPLLNSRGEICGVLGTYLDITDRKRAEAATRSSELRYRRLFESAKDGILILDAATAEVVDVNPFLCALLGLPCEEILGRKIWELGPFRDVPASKVNFRELQQRQYIRYENLPLETADGREIAVEFVSNVYDVLSDKVIQCNIRDITERRKSDEEKARLIQAVEQTEESIMMTDLEGTIVYVNPAFERISGWTREEALGQKPSILKSGQQDDAIYRRLWETLARGEVWTGRLVNRKKDGTLFEEEATMSPVRDPSGEILNYVAAKRDVTAARQLEQQLFQAQKMEAVGRLAAGIAHDFNNLLGVISGYGEIVMSGLGAADPLRDDVGQILKAAERAATSTRQLLAFGRKQILQTQVVDLNAVVFESEKLLPRLLGENVEVSIRLEPDLGRVRADPGQLNQVLLNLLLNARDAMPDGGRITIATGNAELDSTYAVTHSQVRPGSYVLLSVTDTGQGMDAATQARIFEPFYTTKPSGKGTGLGLATVHGIVQQSGGQVYVYSEVGVGTTFKIYLPRVDERADAAAKEDGAEPAPRGTETVLLVEDEAALRELLRKTLESSGYAVLVARDGREALELAASHAGSIEVMVSDVIMPGASGPKIAEILATTRPEMRVLYVSGYSDESIFLNGVLKPGTAFLSKPFSLGSVLRRLRRLLDAN